METAPNNLLTRTPSNPHHPYTHRSRGSEGAFDLMDARSSRAPSIASDRPSLLSTHGLVTLQSVHPAPAYVAVAAASQMVTDTNNAILRERFDLRDSSPSPIAETALFSEEALALLNSFLDYILYRVLGAARGPGLARLRTAMVEVLKPRLARDTMAIAEEELRDLMSEEEQEEEEIGERRGSLDDDGDQRRERWDLDETFRRMRLRVMVYTRLGEMEDEDEEQYLDLDESELLNGYSYFSGASAIFLTSTVEYLAEQMLAIAGAAAYSRVLGKGIKRRLSTARSPSSLDAVGPHPPREARPSRVVVEDRDLEKVALNSTLGRLYRTWRQRTRQESGMSSPVNTARRSAAYGHLALPMSPASSTYSVDGASLYRQDSNVSELVNQVVPEHEPSETEIASNIPLPEGEDDVREIEIPGIAKVITDDDEEDENNVPTPVGRPMRPRSFFLPMARMFGFEDENDLLGMQRHRSNSVPMLHTGSLFGDRDDEKDGFVTPTEGPMENDEQEPAGDASKVEDEGEVSTDEEGPEAVAGDDDTETVLIDIKRVSMGVPRSPVVVDTPKYSGSIRSKVSRDTGTPDVSEMPDEESAEQSAYIGRKAPASTVQDTLRMADDAEERPRGLAIANTDAELLDDPEAIGVAKTTDIPTPASSSPVPEQSFPKPKPKTELMADRPRNRTAMSPPIPRSVPSPTTHPSGSPPSDSQEIPAGNAAIAAVSRVAGSEMAIPSESGRGTRPPAPADHLRREPPQHSPRSESQSSSGSGNHGAAATSTRIVAPVHVEQKPGMPSRSAERLPHIHSQAQQAPTASVNNRDGTATRRTSNQLPRETPSTPTSQPRESPNMAHGTAWDQGTVPTSTTSPRKVKESPRRSADTGLSGRVSNASGGSRPRAPSVQTESQHPRPPSSTYSGRRSGSIHTAATPTLHKTNGSETSFGLMKGSLDPRQSEEARTRDFDALVAGEDTVKFTLMSAAMKDIDTSPPRPHASPAVAGRPSSKASKGRTSPPSPVASTTSSSRTKGVIPSSRNAASSSSTGAKPSLLAREPRIQNESMRDFADFIRSTGPYADQPVQPLVDPSTLPRYGGKVPRSSQQTASSGIRGNLGSAASNNSLGLSRSQSDATATSAPTRRKVHLEPRSAAVTSNGGSSDLIDFIRQGPPGPYGDGSHRIPRAVAPFRSTMDSDDLGMTSSASFGRAPGRVPDHTRDLSPHTSMTSTVNSRFSAAPSHGSAAPLLPNPSSSASIKPSLASNVSSSATRTKSSFAPPPTAGGSGMPPRTRRRIKDPYAIDLSDEDEDDDDDDELLGATPAKRPQRQEESLIEFLRATDPPSGNAPQTLTHRAGADGAGSRAREEGGRPPMMKGRPVAPKDARADRRTSTNELADFLRNSGPPPERPSAANVMDKREKTSFWKRGKLRG